jgi:hypothetical protein
MNQPRPLDGKPSLRPLLSGLYLLAAAIVLIPLMELVMGSWPLRPGNASWRFGTLGLLLKSTVTPLLGLGFMMAIAGLLGHGRVLRALSVVGVLAFLAIVGCTLLFTLDFLQVRRMVAANMQPGVQRVALTTLLVAVVLVPVSFAMAIGAWKSASSLTSEAVQRRSAGKVGLVVPPSPNPKESTS